eukprot:3973134-Pyramimonas_sp.AAC.1
MAGAETLCKLNKQTSTNCAMMSTKDGDGNVALGQDEYVKQLRPIQLHALTGADAEAKATASKLVADTFVSSAALWLTP